MSISGTIFKAKFSLTNPSETAKKASTVLSTCFSLAVSSSYLSKDKSTS